MAELTPDEREFVDRMGLVMERLGGSRTMGRIYGWFLICDPPHQSLAELSDTLGISKASASTVARQMRDAGLIERLPAAHRQHRYRITAGGWAQVLRVQFGGVRAGLETFEFGLSLLGDDRAEQRARLEDSRDFFAFIEADADGIVERWREYRAKRTTTSQNERSGE